MPPAYNCVCVYLQVLVQRDEADKKVKVLLAELEGLRDHNVQLQDRADNFKVQAQAKEVGVAVICLSDLSISLSVCQLAVLAA